MTTFIKRLAAMTATEPAESRVCAVAADIIMREARVRSQKARIDKEEARAVLFDNFLKKRNSGRPNFWEKLNNSLDIHMVH